MDLKDDKRSFPYTSEREEDAPPAYEDTMTDLSDEDEDEDESDAPPDYEPSSSTRIPLPCVIPRKRT